MPRLHAPRPASRRARRRSAVVTAVLPLAAAVVPLLGLPGEAGARQNLPPLDSLKREAAAEVASMQKLSQEIVDMLFSYSELGFQEFWTLDYLEGILRRKASASNAAAPACPPATWLRGGAERAGR
jgi:aminobenzoyl-glutamate utilization protein B